MIKKADKCFGCFFAVKNLSFEYNEPNYYICENPSGALDYNNNRISGFYISTEDVVEKTDFKHKKCPEK